MSYNRRLKAFIKSKGVTQTFIANKLGMKLVTFNNLLNDRAALKVETLEAVCRAMGAKPADFFTFKLHDTESGAV